MRTLRLSAPAKINWSLDIRGQRPDGYHLLASLMQSVDLCDRLCLAPAAEDSCLCQPPLTDGAPNLALRAWLALKAELGLSASLAIRIDKQIPLAAGLAGGSSDAAAVLIGADRLLGLGLSQEELCRVGLRLGADLPFCLSGGLALVEGIGERVRPLPGAPVYQLVLVNAGLPLSTAQVYRAYAATEVGLRPDIHGQLRALLAGDQAEIIRCAANSLEAPALALCPAIAAVKASCAALGLPALMSGSGGSVWALAADPEQANWAAAELRRWYPFARAVATLPERGIIIHE